MPPQLWPPLSLIRSAFEAPPGNDPMGGRTAVIVPPGPAPSQPSAVSAAAAQTSHDMLAPLIELARRREAVAARAFSARWAPGRLVSVLHEGRLLGVLLDRCDGADHWHGWMAASEADWAGPHDVLLEPGDEPFEPVFGLIQTWNPVTLVPAPQLCARVLGELSATRLAALRAVADECAGQGTIDIAPAPGRIALRTVADTFTVLSGTPLAAEGDPRADYQALYRAAADQLNAASPMQRPPAAVRRAAALPVADGWGERLRGWWRGDGLWRPALAVLALVVVVQNVGLLGASGSSADAVRFRSAPVAPPSAGASASDLRLRWKPGTDVDTAAQLLRSAGATVVGGPDTAGNWQLHLVQPDEGRRVLQSSSWVDSLGPP